jgi:hypothetical protein
MTKCCHAPHTLNLQLALMLVLVRDPEPGRS